MNPLLKREFLLKLGYNPFSPEVPLSDIEPFDGEARGNPSKQLQTLLNAMKESGGWYNKPMAGVREWGDEWGEGEWQLNILSGPYTGCYQGKRGRPNLAYYPAFKPFMDRAGVLWMARYAPQLKELRDLNRAIARAEKAAGTHQRFPGAMFYNQGMAPRVHARIFIRTPEDIRKLESRGSKLIEFGIGHKKNVTAPANVVADWLWAFGYHDALLYVMAKCTNTPIEKVIADLEAEPRRVLSLSGTELPTHARDRVRFSRVFLDTWSAQKATKALLPYASLSLDLRGHQFEPARWLLSRVKEPRQVEALLSDRPEGKPYFDTWSAKQFLQTNKVSKKDWIVLAEKLRVKQLPLRIIEEYVYRIKAMAPFLAETVEGRRLLELLDHPLDWPVLGKIQVQERIDTLYQTFEEQQRAGREVEDEEYYAHWHQQGARLLSMLPPIPGVRITPLTSQADFSKEGRQMHHCARGYFHQDSGWLFNFELLDPPSPDVDFGPEGVQHRPVAPRATLELSVSEKARQSALGKHPDAQRQTPYQRHREALLGTGLSIQPFVRQFYGPSVILNGDELVCSVCKEPVFEASPSRARTCGNQKPDPRLEQALQTFVKHAYQITPEQIYAPIRRKRAPEED